AVRRMNSCSSGKCLARAVAGHLDSPRTMPDSPGSQGRHAQDALREAARREKQMARTSLRLATAFAAASLLSTHVLAQDQEIKIGVIYDFTGPFAAGGSEAAAIGTQIAIDMVNEQGGVEGY